VKTAVAVALLVAALAVGNVDAAPPSIRVRISNEMTRFYIEGYVWFLRLDRSKWRRVTGSSIAL
jgi:hypothetical protein